MTTRTLNDVLRNLHTLTDAYEARELSDGELLERFHAQREDLAFALLLQRHGPMVWGVCQRVLRDSHRAEDAFQAAFFVLVQKARTIRTQESVGSWLYGVAYRVAVRARKSALTLREREQQLLNPSSPISEDDSAWRELCAGLDDELSRLPEKYRIPIVLCYFEGKTQEQAAQQLGCPRTSLSSRLIKARALLHERLVKRGHVLSLGMLTTLLMKETALAAPADLILTTGRAAAMCARHAVGAEVFSPQVAALGKGVLATMTTTKTTFAVALVLALAVGAGSAFVLARGSGAAQPDQTMNSKDSTALARAEDTAALPEAAAKDQGAALFRDATPGSGVDFTYRNGEEADQFAIIESLGGGVALIDYDGDGLLDILVTGGGYFTGDDKKQVKGHPCRLFKNLGNCKFKDVTIQVGIDTTAFYTHGCAVVDYDCDGWPDLVITGYQRLLLYHNESDGKGGRRFVDVTRIAGLTENLWSTSAAWADFDGDGYPDLYVCHYVDWSPSNNPVGFANGKRDICPPKQFQALPHKIYRNQGNGTFIDVSKEAGLRVGGKGLGVIAVDLNDDGKPDIYVANDTVDNFLYMNRSVPGKIRFEELGLSAGVARDDRGVPTGSKGLAVGDYDNSGRASLWVTNYEGETHSLFHNDCEQGREPFRFASQRAGISAIGQLGVGWGTDFFDFDHDGWLDLFIANGHSLRSPSDKARSAQKPFLLRNRDGKFVDVSPQAGPYFQNSHRARGVAFGDLDNDGNIDIVVSHLNEPVVLLRNKGKVAQNHWLGVQLAGKNGRNVAGARLSLEVDGQSRQTRFAKGGGSFASSSDPRHVFGLGPAKQGKLTVRWPSGKEQSWQGLEVDRYWRLIEGEKEAEKIEAQNPKSP